MNPEWNPKAPKVPVDKNGNWMSYPEYRHSMEGVEPFYEEMTIHRMVSGYSGKHIDLIDRNGKTYPMFVKDLVEYISNGNRAENGVLYAYWTASKRGSNYGIRALKRRERENLL